MARGDLPHRRATYAILVLAGCTYAPTELRVVVDTDLRDDPTLELRATARRGSVMIARGAAPDQRWCADASGCDGGRAFGALPASFAVIPGAGAPRDGTVTLLVEALTSTASLRRTATVAFVPGQTDTLQIFLTARCLEPDPSCGGQSRQDCCEARHLTCGSDGECVSTTPMPTMDAAATVDAAASADGAPTMDAGPPGPCDGAAAGASCVGGVCDGEGTCVPCTAGAPCSPGVCASGAIDCSSGAPVCAPTGSLSLGTSCGAGLVCDGAGSCALRADCALDAVERAAAGGTSYEFVTAYGRYWALNVATGAYTFDGLDLGASNYAMAGEPCHGVSSPCVLDTLTFFMDGSRSVQGVTAYGRFWNFFTDDNSALPGNGALLANAGRWNTTACAGHPDDCHFDARTTITLAGTTFDVVTAYGHYYANNVADNAPTSDSGRLVSAVAPYSDACAGHPDDCTLDEIWYDPISLDVFFTAYGRYYHYRWTGPAYADSGVPLYTIPSMAHGPCRVH